MISKRVAEWCPKCTLRLAPYDLRTVYQGTPYHRDCFLNLVRVLVTFWMKQRIKRLRILFLGNSYNPIGAACLQTLVELEHEVIVGDYNPLAQGAWRVARKRLKSRGWRLILNRTSYLIRCKTRIALRRMGAPLSGFASLPEITRACGLNVIQCANPNSAEFVQQVRLLGVQLIVVANFSRILKRALLETPDLGCINVHPSLLPRYRGPEPFYWVLANREKTTGVTVHYMDEAIDSGDIILQKELEIRPKETETTLLHRSAAVAAELLHEAIPLLQAGRAPRIRQDQTVATYYSFPSKSFAQKVA